MSTCFTVWSTPLHFQNNKVAVRKIYNLRFHNGNFLITDVMVTMSSFMCKVTSTCVAISRQGAVTSNDWLPMQSNHCLTNSLSFSIIRQIRYNVYISLLQMCRTTVCLTFKQSKFSISHIVNEFKQMQSNSNFEKQTSDLFCIILERLTVFHLSPTLYML